MRHANTDVHAVPTVLHRHIHLFLCHFHTITYPFCLYKMSHFHLTQLSNPLFTISLPPVGLEIIPICLRRELGTWLRYEIRWGVLFVCESGNTFCVKFEVLSSGTKALVSCVQLEN